MKKTNSTPTPNEVRMWHHIDAQGKILGKVATEAAVLLRGKLKPEFRRHNDVGDIVVITNAAEVVVTGNKETDKLYRTHSGYPGGLKETSLAKVRATHPNRIIEHAVSGMLPKTKQRDIWMNRLKIYSGAEHPHAANLAQKSEK